MSEDIVYLSFSLWQTRKERGHSSIFVGVALLTATLVLFLQFLLLYYFNYSAATYIYCGDIIRMINEDGDPRVLWNPGAPRLFREQWNDIVKSRDNETTTFEDRFSDTYAYWFEQERHLFINKLAKEWKSDEFGDSLPTTDITEKTCAAKQKSSKTIDIIRTNNIKMDDLKRVGIHNISQDMIDIGKQTVNQYKQWTCPKEYSLLDGTCLITWDCSIVEWKAYCKDQISFATVVPVDARPAWIISLVLLAATITRNIFERLLLMRQAPPYFKFMLLMQCIISANICVLNASLTAGCDHAIDILMSSVALLCLNEAVDIMGIFFKMQMDQEDEDDLIAANVDFRDRVFARCLAFPHFIIVLLYGLMFLGIFGADQPLNGFTFAVYVQPYSPLGIPLFIIPWYAICYFDAFEKVRLRLSCCFKQKKKDEVKKHDDQDFQPDTERGLKGISPSIELPSVTDNNRDSSLQKRANKSLNEIQDEKTEVFH